MNIELIELTDRRMWTKRCSSNNNASEHRTSNSTHYIIIEHTWFYTGKKKHLHKFISIGDH